MRFLPLRRRPLGAFVPAATWFTLALAPALAAQEATPGSPRVVVEPAELVLAPGAKARLRASLVDVAGHPVEGEVFFFSRARRALRASREGEIEAVEPGRHEVVARSMIDGQRGPEAVVVVTVPYPAPARLQLEGVPARLYAGTAVRLHGRVLDAEGTERRDLTVAFEVEGSEAAHVDRFGTLEARAPGAAKLVARSGDLVEVRPLEVIANPVASLELKPAAEIARTGDVVPIAVTARLASGAAVHGVPVHFSLQVHPDDALGNGATGQITEDGRFVAETPGLYTVVATCGAASARASIRCEKRFAGESKLVQVGHGEVLDVHTSDLWVWEGADGRDYAVTGTWGADGDAIFWDVTDPKNLERIATVRVDARTVNDVKVSADGKLCVISREGASNRRNGIVGYDVTDPRKPEQLFVFDDELTGGVHNLYIDQGFVYALSAGRRYDVIDVRDPRSPKRVSSYQIFEPGASIHDVWVSEGIAFSSNWRYGIHLVDVGNGIKGGSPENPVPIGNYAYPSGWNHAAFPWRSPDTGKFYVIAGDEAFPYGLSVKDHPTYPRGWIHFIDFTDPENPREVARYQVPEAGTHNLWVEGTTLYVAYYNAGLRVVDISGDLEGDLYRQGRELGWFLPTHPQGVVPNAPMTWGPQPYKGHIFCSDWNSGLWCVKLEGGNERAGN